LGLWLELRKKHSFGTIPNLCIVPYCKKILCLPIDPVCKKKNGMQGAASSIPSFPAAGQRVGYRDSKISKSIS